MLIVQLVQGNISSQNSLVTFSTKSLLLLLKNVCKLWGICSSDLLNAFLVFWTSLDDYLQENVYRRKPSSCTTYHTVSSLLGVFVNSPGKSWSTDLILDALQALTFGIIKRLY